MEISIGGGICGGRETRIPRKKIDSPPKNNQNTGMARDTRGTAWEEMAWIPVIGNDLTQKKMTHKTNKWAVINVITFLKNNQMPISH